MAVASELTSRTISLPAKLAVEAEELARREGRSLSELLEEALRGYQKQQSEKFWAGIEQYATTRNPHGYTEEDVPRLIKEWRAERRTRIEPEGKE